MTAVTVGVIGGGQLAWMMAGVAPKLGINLVVQTPSAQDPAVGVASDAIFAAIDDAAATAQLATRCDVITFENEFINLEALTKLAQQGICFRPHLEALSPLLDKYNQRCYLQEIGLPVPQFSPVSDSNSNQSNFGFPVVLKARRHGYDGRGTFIIQQQQELEKLCRRLETDNLMLEEYVPFERELAVMAARSITGEVVVYPVVETEQENQVCHRVIAPAQISPQIKEQVLEIARTLLEKLKVVGIFGIELFLTSQGQVLVNEIAPRTHNSGHFTIDTCDVSQFEMHLRAVAGLPVSEPMLLCAGSVMVNLLGYENSQSDYAAKRQQIAAIPQAFVHWYGKTESRLGRKLGHVTVLLNPEQMAESATIAQKVESLWYG